MIFYITYMTNMQFIFKKGIYVSIDLHLKSCILSRIVKTRLQSPIISLPEL